MLAQARRHLRLATLSGFHLGACALVSAGLWAQMSFRKGMPASPHQLDSQSLARVVHASSTHVNARAQDLEGAVLDQEQRITTSVIRKQLYKK
eukprot:4783834-Amphidinium_carterae.1